MSRAEKFTEMVGARIKVAQTACYGDCPYLDQYDSNYCVLFGSRMSDIVDEKDEWVGIRRCDDCLDIFAEKF